jgi:hypothetical protein
MGNTNKRRVNYSSGGGGGCGFGFSSSGIFTPFLFLRSFSEVGLAYSAAATSGSGFNQLAGGALTGGGPKHQGNSRSGFTKIMIHVLNQLDANTHIWIGHNLNVAV